MGNDGIRYLEDEFIWNGYLAHFNGLAVRARRLSQRDYETGKPIVIMWPDAPAPDESTIELYFNERLVKYPTSFMGHMAVNVSGEIFNFSHLINENEVMKSEEYFFRPALGEFAPHPVSGRDNTDDPQKPYYDKFGRLFMRTIHVLRITGLDTQKFSQLFHDELDMIRNTPADPKKPGAYRDFNILTNSCSTIIRDGFKKYGFKNIRGIFPRDLFVNISYFFLKQLEHPQIKASCHTLQQLKVPEAAASALPPLLNPLNLVKHRIMQSS
ncbi:MAG: hypothetical protein CVU51_08730 [Deltaproteobacteria bacterium HGW-Deltaproteobacteria-1]|nr:MAG: hypothetical protein CVU51_08730 [Deltaproteobacteria bacterium HGW-Deltaproteobacteria-1]